MLRILLWRSWFELLNLAKIWGYRGPRLSYFAFGGNLDPAVLNRRRIRAHSVRFAYLDGHELAFDHAIPFIGVAFASVVPRAGAQVPGFILTIDRIDALRMDCFEAHAILRRYLKRSARIDGTDVFFYASAHPETGLLPTTEYVQKLRNAYRAHLPATSPFLRRLETHPSISEMVRKHPPEFMVRQYDRFGSALRPALQYYDELCVKVFVPWIYRGSWFGERVPI